MDDASYESAANAALPTVDLELPPVGSTIPAVDPTLPFPSFSPDIAAAVRRFHASIAGYEPTPLLTLKQLAATLNVDKVGRGEGGSEMRVAMEVNVGL